MAGRTVWLPKDAAWHRRGYVVELGEAHGPAGPLVLDWLNCEAKAQGPYRGHDGSVKAGYAAVARACFSTADEVRAIVALAAEVGALDDLEDSGRVFECRISGWQDDVEKPLDATRKAAERAAKTTPKDAQDEPGQSGTSGDTSHDVPRNPVQGQDKDKTTSSLRSEDARGRAPKQAGQKRKPSPPPADELPADLEPLLAAAANEVHRRLTRLAVAKGADPPTLARCGQACQDFQDRDLGAIAADVEDYWTHGRGSGKPLRDVVRAFRNRCGDMPPAARPTHLRPVPATDARVPLHEDPDVAPFLRRPAPAGDGGAA